MNATPWQLAQTERMFTKMLRSDAAAQQREKCTYCREKMAAVTAEHLQPRSRGGSTVRKNIKAACVPCNRAKGNGTEASFRRTLHQGIQDIPRGDMSVTLAWIRFRLNRRIERAEKRICAFVGLEAA